jgi:large subunit ribosomal protein L24
MRNSNNRYHQTTKLHIKKGDTVRVLSGNDRKKEGLVLKVLPQDYRAVVEGVHIVSKHKKPTAKNPQGSIIKTEAPVHISNLMVVDPGTKQTTRIGRKINSEGKLERYSKTTGEFI